MVLIHIVRTMTTSSKHKTRPKLIGPSFIALQVRDLQASKAFYVDQIGLTASRRLRRALLFSTPDQCPSRSGHRWLTSVQLASWDGACLFGSPQRMPMRSTRNWWRKAYPCFTHLLMGRLGDSSLSVTRMDTQLPPTQRSQSRQRQRWTQAADI